MRLGLPSFNSLSKFCLEILPAAVAMVVVGYLLSYVQADRADGALPKDAVIQSTQASEIEEVRNDRAMMRDVIKSRRIAEEQAAEQAREAKIAAENALVTTPATAEPSPTAVASKEATPLPPVRRPAPAGRGENKSKPKPAAEPKLAGAPPPAATQVVEAAPPPPPAEERKGPVMFVVDKAGELGRKTVATTGEAVAWVVSLPASLMGIKRVFSDSPPPQQQSGHILNGS